MQTVARVIVSDTGGTLAEQIERRPRAERAVPPFAPQRATAPSRARRSRVEVERPDLVAFNGIGGFTPRRPRVRHHHHARAAHAGAVGQRARQPVVRHRRQRERRRVHLVRERARLPADPWHNDPVSDASGEAFYLRDEDDGRFWSPTPLPARAAAAVHDAATASATASSSTPRTASRRELRDVRRDRRAGEVRRPQAAQPLGRGRGGCRSPATSSWCSARTARPTCRTSSPRSTRRPARCSPATPTTASSRARVAFLDCSEAQRTVTGDRTEFLGRNGSPAQPAAHEPRAAVGPRRRRARSVPGDAGDARPRRRPGARGRVHVRLRPRPRRRAPPGQRFRGTGPARVALEGVWAYWNRTLGAVHVQTPDPALNFLANGWLLYQVLACRMWARSGFYQSGGAFGFRDQLQDAMALVHAEPALLREQLLRCRGAPVPRGRRAALVASAAAAAACARASPTTTSGCRYAACRYVARARRHRRARREGAVPRGPPGQARRGQLLRPAGALRGVGDALRALRARDRARPALRRARPAADGQRRLERRHEPGRRARQGRERLARVLPVRRARRSSPTLARAPRRRRVRRHAASTEAAQLREQHRGSTPGTASGIAAPTSTTASRSARRQAPSARSTRCRRAGRCCPAPAIRARARRRWPPSTRAWSAATLGLIQLFDPPFDKSALEPGLHQGLRPRRARERRPVHARRGLGGDGVRRRRRRASARGSCSA